MEATSDSEFLNYHHLRYFWTVAKEGSLRQAAEKLRVSQPSICTQIQLLESALGEDLFRRSGRSSVLTEFGQLVLGYAEEIFTLGGEVLRAAKQAPTTRSLRLQAGIVDSLPKLVSFDLLRPILEHRPPICLTCHEGKLADLNFGTNDGLACAPALLEAALAPLPGLAPDGMTHVTNGRFKGGYITRRYGQPATGVHAIQLEMCQSVYMNETAPFAYRPDLAQRVQPLLRTMLGGALAHLQGR